MERNRIQVTNVSSSSWFGGTEYYAVSVSTWLASVTIEWSVLSMRHSTNLDLPPSFLPISLTPERRSHAVSTKIATTHEVSCNAHTFLLSCYIWTLRYTDRIHRVSNCLLWKSQNTLCYIHIEPIELNEVTNPAVF